MHVPEWPGSMRLSAALHAGTLKQPACMPISFCRAYLCHGCELVHKLHMQAAAAGAHIASSPSSCMLQVLTHRCQEAQHAKQARLERSQQYTPLDSQDGSTAPVKPTFIAVDALAHAQHPETPHPDQLAGTDPVAAMQTGMLGSEPLQNGQQSANQDSQKQGQHAPSNSTVNQADDIQNRQQQSSSSRNGSMQPEAEPQRLQQNGVRESRGMVRSWPSSSNLVRESASAAGKSHAAAAALGLAGTSDHSRHAAARASRGSSSTQETDTPTAAGEISLVNSLYICQKHVIVADSSRRTWRIRDGLHDLSNALLRRAGG